MVGIFTFAQFRKEVSSDSKQIVDVNIKEFYQQNGVQEKKVSLINFWATWCGPCRFELPMLARWARAHPDVVVLGVAVDRDRRAVERFCADRDLPYPILWDSRGVQERYKVTTLPTTVVIDEAGRVKGAHTGIVFGPELDLLLL